jgi:hypothetical protein
MPITEIPARLAAREPDRRDQDCVETPGAADPLGQPATPAELGTDYVGGGGQQDGQGDHCGGDEPGGEQARGRRAGQRPQRLGRVLRGDDALMMPAERRRGGDREMGFDRVPQMVAGRAACRFDSAVGPAECFL